MRLRPHLSALALTFFATAPAAATFHLMQIEQVIGATCGDVSQQAIQLRMRAAGQNLVASASIYAYDAAGANSVLLLDLASNVSTGVTGSRVLLTTAAFAAATGVTPDFILTAPIPASYLAAGRLTWEGDGGTIWWSLAWGGAAYTGSNLGAPTNDADGDFGPPFASPLASAVGQAILFTGTATALSTSNAADYTFTTVPPTFTNNGGTGFTLVDCAFGDGFESGSTAAWSSTVP
jgi:hypothetical protein